MSNRFRRLALLLAAAVVTRAGAQAVPYDDYTSAYVLGPGLNPPVGSFNGAGATPSTANDGCAAVIDAWFSYTATQTGPVRFLGTDAAGGFSNAVRLEVFDACGGIVIGGIAPCVSGPNDALVDLFAGQSCLVRAYGNFAVTLPSAYGLRVQAPANAVVNGFSYEVTDGINPRAPLGDPVYAFTNVASDVLSPSSLAACAPHFCPVKFHYEASATGVATVSTCAPPGFPAGSMLDSIVWVYDTAIPPTLLACVDDACEFHSTVYFQCAAGQSYAIYVGSYVGTPQGTFHLTITPPPPGNDGCGGAMQVPPGPFASVDATTAGATPTANAPATCVAPGADDVFFTWTCYVSQTVAVRLEATDGHPGFVGADHVSVRLEDGCGNPASVFAGLCGTSVLLNAVAGTTYLIRAANTGAVPHGPFALAIDFTPPVNDEPSGALPLVPGVNPASGTVGYATTGATQSAGVGTCVAFERDVFFSFVAPTTGLIDVSLEHPPGSYFLEPAVLEAHPTNLESNPPLACMVTYVGGPHLAFSALANQSYAIRVGVYGGFGADFALHVAPRLELRLSSPLGAGSLKAEDVGGAHGDVYLNLFTLGAGAFPNGPWFGISPTLTEVTLQIGSGQPPFVGTLDAQGTASFGPLTGLPPLTLYGVALQIDPAGFLVNVSAPVSFAVQ